MTGHPSSLIELIKSLLASLWQSSFFFIYFNFSLLSICTFFRPWSSRDRRHTLCVALGYLTKSGKWNFFHRLYSACKCHRSKEFGLCLVVDGFLEVTMVGFESFLPSRGVDDEVGHISLNLHILSSTSPSTPPSIIILQRSEIRDTRCKPWQIHC